LGQDLGGLCALPSRSAAEFLHPAGRLWRRIARAAHSRSRHRHGRAGARIRRPRRQLAAEAGLVIDFRCAPAEVTPFADGAFDRVTANQCWLYFDTARAIPEVRRLLAAGGLLVTSHFSWLPLLDPVAQASEALILKHNPDWTGAGYAAEIPVMPRWAEADFRLRAMFMYDEAIAFTRESWRGRIRANRGIGAALSAEAVAAFDAEHDALLRGMVKERFTVLHRLEAHFLEFK
jgi:SAM-dependent methyltransferase